MIFPEGDTCPTDPRCIAALMGLLLTSFIIIGYSDVPLVRLDTVSCVCICFSFQRHLDRAIGYPSISWKGPSTPQSGTKLSQSIDAVY